MKDRKKDRKDGRTDDIKMKSIDNVDKAKKCKLNKLISNDLDSISQNVCI